jgi:hypothetical protein
MGPLSMEQALAEEASALADPGIEAAAKNLRQIAGRQDAERARFYNDSDVRDGRY